MSNPDLERQRRNLFSISISIIIFYLLDAKFAEKGSLFFGSITYPDGNGVYLLYTLWGGFLYFLWRFWVFGGRTARKTLNDVFLVFLRKDSIFINHMYEMLEKEALGNFIIERTPMEAFNKGPLEGKPNATRNGLRISLKTHYYYVDASYKLQHGSHAKSDTIKYKTTLLNHPIHASRNIFKVIFTEHTFGELVLPFLVAWWAFCLIAVDFISKL